MEISGATHSPIAPPVLAGVSTSESLSSVATCEGVRPRSGFRTPGREAPPHLSRVGQ